MTNNYQTKNKSFTSAHSGNQLGLNPEVSGVFYNCDGTSLFLCIAVQQFKNKGLLWTSYKPFKILPNSSPAK